VVEMWNMLALLGKAVLLWFTTRNDPKERQRRREIKIDKETEDVLEASHEAIDSLDADVIGGCLDDLLSS